MRVSLAAALIFVGYSAAYVVRDPSSEIIIATLEKGDTPVGPHPVVFPKPVPHHNLVPPHISQNTIILPALPPMLFPKHSEEPSESCSSSSSEEHQPHKVQPLGKYHGQKFGQSGESKPWKHGGAPDSESEDRFGAQLEHAILKRISEGKPVKVSLKQKSKLKLEQKRKAGKEDGHSEKPNKPEKGQPHHNHDEKRPHAIGKEYGHNPYADAVFVQSTPQNVHPLSEIHPTDIAALQHLAGLSAFPPHDSPNPARVPDDEQVQHISADLMAQLFPDSHGGSPPSFPLPASFDPKPEFQSPNEVFPLGDSSVNQFPIDPSQLLQLIFGAGSVLSPTGSSPRPSLPNAPTPENESTTFSSVSTQSPPVTSVQLSNDAPNGVSASKLPGAKTSKTPVTSPKPKTFTKSLIADSTNEVNQTLLTNVSDDVPIVPSSPQPFTASTKRGSSISRRVMRKSL